MAFNPNMSNREVANLSLITYETGLPFLYVDFANLSTTNLQADRVFAVGGQGAPNRIAFDGKRQGTLKVETQITPMKFYAMLAGSNISTTATVLRREKLTSATKAVTLTDTPVAGTVHIFEASDDCGTELTITVASKTATISDSGYTDGEVIAYYFTALTTGVTSVTFDTKTFPKAFVVCGETPWKTESDEIVAMKLQYFKAQPQSNFEISFSNTGEAVNLSITFDLLANSDNKIYEMTIEE